MVFAKEGLKMIEYKKVFMVDVAQLVRAPLCGSGGRGFKSRHPPHIKRLELLILSSVELRRFSYPKMAGSTIR